ncbi:hypothetical protein RHSIM_Rhsim04G0208400 [Rhododendron simsii]|uniref:Dienelactone hydrolase domain-containing protein n=1 Tax=Rhododendron simsii TaxID=118357 RepID=A0A834LSL1_RHOSS|nr:hypothetical protein RHSIM_Rhsim04G0208400 [Rhododendron simsii]
MSGPQCCENPPVLDSGCGGVGHEEEIGGLMCYVTGPPHSKRAVLMLSDIFGYKAPKLRLIVFESKSLASIIKQKILDIQALMALYASEVLVVDILYLMVGSSVMGAPSRHWRLHIPYWPFGSRTMVPQDLAMFGEKLKLADKVSASGFYVVVPDFFYGDPYVPDNPERPLDNVERPLPVWLKDHGPDKGFEDAKPVIQALKSKGVSSIGAAGFCWGAKPVVELGNYAYIQAAVLLHPSFVSLEDFQAVKVPISILGAEVDIMSPPELLKKFEEALNAKPEVDSFVKIFPGVEHGWTVRYKDEDEVAVKSANEAHEDMLNWFVKYVK